VSYFLIHSVFRPTCFISMFNMSQTVNNLRTHQLQYVKRNKISDINNSVVSIKVRRVEIQSLVLKKVRRPEKDCLLKKHRLITRSSCTSRIPKVRGGQCPLNTPQTSAVHPLVCPVISL